MGKHNTTWVPANNLEKLCAIFDNYREAGEALGLSSSGVRGMVVRGLTRPAYELAAKALLEEMSKSKALQEPQEEAAKPVAYGNLITEGSLKLTSGDPIQSVSGEAEVELTKPYWGDEESLPQEPTVVDDSADLKIYPVFIFCETAELAEAIRRYCRHCLEIPNAAIGGFAASEDQS